MNNIQEKLFSKRDLKFKEFTQRLIPNVNNKLVIGVKIPDIRIINKTLTNEEKQEFLISLPHKYLEENILHSIIISECKDLNETISLIDKFIPYIDNWMVSDILLPITYKKNLKSIHDKVLLYLNSEYEYGIRLGLVLLLNLFLKEEFNSKDLIIISKLNTDKYYINMAISWYYSYALIYQYDKTIKLFEQKKLNKWVHNKSIQKSLESYRIDNTKKEYLKTLKIN